MYSFGWLRLLVQFLISLHYQRLHFVTNIQILSFFFFWLTTFLYISVCHNPVLGKSSLDHFLFSRDCLKMSNFDLISCNLFPMFGSLNSKSTKKHKTAGICSSCLTIQLILSAPSGKYKSKFSFFRLHTGYDWSNGTKVKFTGALWLFMFHFKAEKRPR